MIFDGDFIDLLKRYGVVIFFKLVNFSVKVFGKFLPRIEIFGN